MYDMILHLDCVRYDLCVADDFGYVMPGQRQKRVSERR